VSTNEGQVLAPMATLVSTTNTIIHERLRTVQTLLDGEIDPRRPDTTLGKAIATITGATITGLLDP
jgi:Trp operon repressor